MFFIVFTGVLCLIFNFHTLIAQKQGVQMKKELKDYDWTVWCKFQPNRYDCGKPDQPRFYYDIKMQDCKTFSFGGCPTHFNSFNTLPECHENCREYGVHTIRVNLTDDVSCRLQPDFGECDGYHPMFYFDINERICKGFSYSGCGGNYNRFPNTQICAAVCGANAPF